MQGAATPALSEAAHVHMLDHEKMSVRSLDFTAAAVCAR